MAVADGDETEVIERTEGESEQSETTQVDPPEAAEDEVVVTIGDEESPPPEDESAAPEWVRELRKSNRETVRKNKELERELAALRAPQQTALGEKPTLQACDYDEDRFARELESWNEKKRSADALARKKQEAAEADQKAWAARQANYGKLKGDLRVKDFDEAEEAVKGGFTEVQQAVIVKGAENPAVIVYALGKNPKKAKELASIADPIEFAFAVAKLETQLKVAPRKVAPPPESVVRGSGSLVSSPDAHLEKLEAEADRTGDRSKIVAYKRSLREKK